MIFSITFQNLLAKIAFFPLILSLNEGKLEFCHENTCNEGFTCRKHPFYANNVCRPIDNNYLPKLTELLIEGYGSELKTHNNMIKMYKIMAKRESNNKWWLHHWHKSDIVSIPKSRKRMYYVYKDSDFWEQKDLWQGYGLFGQNSVNFLHYINPNASPVILMHPYFAIRAYNKAADRVYHKLKAGVTCNGKVFTGSFRNKPTISDIHNAVSGGKICPRPKTHKHEKWMRKNAKFAYTTFYIPTNS